MSYALTYSIELFLNTFILEADYKSFIYTVPLFLKDNKNTIFVAG